MALITPLTPAEIADLRASLPSWHLNASGTAIERKLLFADFKVAFAFMGAVAMLADAQDHHPEWSNTYNRVAIRLTTHDADGLTQNDVRLAHDIDAAAMEFQAGDPQ